MQFLSAFTTKTTEDVIGTCSISGDVCCTDVLVDCADNLKKVKTFEKDEQSMYYSDHPL